MRPSYCGQRRIVSISVVLLGSPSSLIHRTRSFSTGRTVEEIIVLYVFHYARRTFFSWLIMVDDQGSWKRHLHDFQCRVQEIPNQIWLRILCLGADPFNLNKKSERKTENGLFSPLVVSHYREFHSKFSMSLLMFADLRTITFQRISRHFSDHGSGHCQCTSGKKGELSMGAMV